MTDTPEDEIRDLVAQIREAVMSRDEDRIENALAALEACVSDLKVEVDDEDEDEDEPPPTPSAPTAP